MAASLVTFTMPGLVGVTTASSSSDENEVAVPGSTPPTSDDGGQYPAASFPGYAEKPLNEQLEPIAVIGMGCRLPGDVGSASDFWDMMINKKTGQTPKVPSSRFNIDAHFHKNNDRPGSFGVRGGYFLNGDLSEFDPGLFNITPIEAMWMDPQQRKLLEVVYEPSNHPARRLMPSRALGQPFSPPVSQPIGSRWLSRSRRSDTAWQLQVWIQASSATASATSST